MKNNMGVTLANANKHIDEVLYKPIYELGNENKPANNVVYGNELFEFLDDGLVWIDSKIQSGVKGIIDYFHETNIVIEGLEDYKTKTPNISQLQSARLDLLKMSDSIKFSDLGRRKVPVMLGLKLSYPELIEVLNKNASYTKGLVSVLKTFDSYVNSLLESKNGLINASIDTSEVKALNKSVDTINKTMSNVTSTAILRDRLPLNKLTNSVRELSEVMNDALKLGNSYKMEELELVKELNDGIVQKLTVIYEQAKENKSEINKKTLKEFSEYIGAIAKYTTAVTFSFYLYYQTVDMLIGAKKIIDLQHEDHTVIDNIILGFKSLTNVFRNLS